jgi:uncharacterized protein YbaR (Trm112 family)
MAIKKDLLEILCCPQCKGDLNLNEQEDQFTCIACKLIYPIRNGIPILLADEAAPF